VKYVPGAPYLDSEMWAGGPDLKLGCPIFAQSHRAKVGIRAKLEPSQHPQTGSSDQAPSATRKSLFTSDPKRSQSLLIIRPPQRWYPGGCQILPRSPMSLTASCVSRIISTQPQTSAMTADVPHTTPTPAAIWNADGQP